MNRYGNEYGFHSIGLTKTNIIKINKGTGIDFIDSSWHNDTCDSVYHELKASPHEYLQVYLPNSSEYDSDNERYNTYCLMDENSDVLLSTEDINEIINLILKITNYE